MREPRDCLRVVDDVETVSEWSEEFLACNSIYACLGRPTTRRVVSLYSVDKHQAPYPL